MKRLRPEYVLWPARVLPLHVVFAGIVLSPVGVIAFQNEYYPCTGYTWCL